MSNPAIIGILMAVGAVIAAYWMGHSAGYRAGQGEGFDEGKREGAREGSMRGYAVGFDRGRRGNGEEGGEESSPRIGLGFVAILLAALMTFYLAAKSRQAQQAADFLPASTSSPLRPIERFEPTSNQIERIEATAEPTPPHDDLQRQLLPVPNASPMPEQVEQPAAPSMPPRRTNSPW